MTTGRVRLGHGSGGRLTHDLIRDVFARAFANPILAQMNDAAVMEMPAGRIALTTDSYVVQPLFFPGGDIGRLAVCGTVNDLAMVGARPLYLTAGFIIEEGLPLADLETIVASMASAASEAGVRIVTGDTKVVNSGAADRLFINTAGIGIVPAGVAVSGAGARPGDVVILSGAVGDHGVTILSEREGLALSGGLATDCAPLNGLVRAMLDVPAAIHSLRDPTRGGLATTLVELAAQSHVGIEIEESLVPVHEPVRGACELLGLDPLYVANEGKLIAIVAGDAAARVLTRIRNERYGEEAVVIGRVLPEHPGRVVLRTAIGSSRLLDMLSGDQLPRIC